MEDHPEASGWQATDTAGISSAYRPLTREREPATVLIISADCMTFLSVVLRGQLFFSAYDQRVRQDANLCAQTPACAPGRQSML